MPPSRSAFHSGFYEPLRPSRSRFLDVRGLSCHVREWGAPDAPLLVLLHGWMDVSASFQFVVDALRSDWHVVAPDWRGFGLSQRAGDAYWFPDYLADLDAILAALSPQAPAKLVGHSLGGNVAMLYAGVRPARVERLVSLDGFGLADAPPENAPGRLEKWLREISAPVPERSYPDLAALAARLIEDNPRLTPARAAFIAAHRSEPDGAGGLRHLADAAHRRISPILYRRAEALACWRRIAAPTLWVEPSEPTLRHRLGVADDVHAEGRAAIRDLAVAELPDSGHNLHHDQPAALARILEDFLLSK